MIKLSVLLTDADEICALTIIRSLGKRNIKLTVGAENFFAVGLYSKYSNHRFFHPSPLRSPNSYLRLIFEMVRKKKFDAFFPVSFFSMLLIAQYKDLLSRYVAIPIADYEKLVTANDKGRIMQRVIHLNIPCPKTFFISRIEQFSEIREQLKMHEVKLPIVIKPRFGAGGFGVSYVRRSESLYSCIKTTLHKFGPSLVQEYIPGSKNTYGLEVLFNQQSNVRAFFVHRRLREYPITGGPSSLRESVCFPEILELGTKLLKALNWYGVAMVEFKVDPRDNKPKLIEVNPRFWGSLALPVAAGVDFPYLLYKMALEGDIKPIFNYELGFKCRRLMRDIVVLAEELRTTHNKAEVMKEFLKIYYDDVLSLDDPFPIIGQIIALLFQKVQTRKNHEKQFAVANWIRNNVLALANSNES
jgi:predicted ATP-grasp superfamily ATP-dependent carboligase